MSEPASVARLPGRAVRWAVASTLASATPAERHAACPKGQRRGHPGDGWAHARLLSRALRSLAPWARAETLRTALSRALARLEEASVVEVHAVPTRRGGRRVRWVRLLAPEVQEGVPLMRPMCFACCYKPTGRCPGCGGRLAKFTRGGSEP
jgi:hypothetical protein